MTIRLPHGRTAVALSDDGVNPQTLENSERKAYTALTTKGPSGEVGKRPQPGQASACAQTGIDRIAKRLGS